MKIKDAIVRVVQNQNISRDEMIAIMRLIMSGQCVDIEVAAFLTAMRMKHETVDEITGAALVMRELVTPVNIDAPYLIDIVGTGGDRSHLFNVSTASAFVAAAAGASIAKHGNRSVSSSSGSADLLEEASISLSLSPEQVAKCTENIGIGFMYAPAHHAAMKNVAHIRKALGIQTLFNILGPLSNPAGVDNLIIGVFSQDLCLSVAKVLRELGNKHVMVVHSLDGLDEISIATETVVTELKNESIKEYRIQPEDFGIKRQNLDGLNVANASESLALIRDALDKRKSQYAIKAADMIALNSGAAIYVSGKANSLKQGITMAQETITSGLALDKIQDLANYSKIITEEN